MNVRIFWVRAMKCMYAQTRPRFILSSEGVFGGNGVWTHVNSKGKIPSTENPEEDRSRDAVDSEPKHYELSYSGPRFFCWIPSISLCPFSPCLLPPVKTIWDTGTAGWSWCFPKLWPPPPALLPLAMRRQEDPRSWKYLGPVSWRPTTVRWRQSSQSNRHFTIGTRQTQRFHRLRTCSHTSPRRSPTMVTLHDTRFVECQMVEWRLDCRHLTVVGLNDIGPWPA